MIRKANIKDLCAIMIIINQAKESIKKTGSPQWQNGYPNENTFIEDIRTNQLFVYESNGKEVVGVMAVIDYEPTYEIIKGKWLNEKPYKAIHRIAVMNAYSNQQIAKQMVKYVYDELHATNIRVDTHEKNIKMIRFLEKESFIYCGIIDLTQTNDSSRMAYHKEILK